VRGFKRKFLDFTLAPSQNFLAENFTLPQGEGDEPVSHKTILKIELN
jgi:hypothetical protein